MKIIYLHQFFKFPTDSGGTRSYDLATSFVKEGIDVEIITTSAAMSSIEFEPGWNLLEREGLKIHVLSLDYNNKMSYVKRSIVFFNFLWSSSFKLLSLDADIVLATSTPLTIGLPAIIKKWIHKVPYIFEVRDVWPEAVVAIGAVKNRVLQKLLYSLEKLLYRGASAIVPLSIDMKHSIVSRYPELVDKTVEVIENISETNRFQNKLDFKVSYLRNKLGFQPRFAVLYAGTFGRVNGIDYVVRLAEETMLIDPSVVFILVGNGSERANVEKLAKERGLINRNVFFLDVIPKDDLPQLYYEVDMGSSFVIDIEELWANSANKFFDTLAAGKPVLINHGGWQSRVIEDFNIGYVLPPKVDKDVAYRFVQYSSDTALHRVQCHNALLKARESYALEIAVEKYLNLFKNIV